MSRHASPPRRRIPRWLKVSVIALLVTANLVVFGVWWTIRSAETAFRDNAVQATEVVPELDARPTGPDEPLYFLVIGSDSREGVDTAVYGDFAGARGDVVMVARVDPSGAVELLSVPRDTVVDIEGHGSNRINAAYAFGGAPLMVRTVRESLGLPIHHYVEINFVGFQALVDELGGVTLDFEHPARDLKSGLDVPAGTVTLAGVDALAYARSRSYQEDVDGAWRSMEANDIGRAARQQRLVGAIIDRLARPSTIAETGSVVASFAEHVTVDASLANSSLVELAFSLRNVRGADLGRLILPTVGATLNGASVQVMDEPAASEMLAGFRAGSPMDIEEVADIVTVEVLNGNGVTGSGSRWASHLETAGYEVVRVGDSGSDLATTEIRVAPGYEAAADAVVNDLGFGIVVVGEVEEGRDAVIVLGADAEAS